MSWSPPAPDRCDICQHRISGSFIDGATSQGLWAIMCINCWRAFGTGFGIGRGQRYNLETLEKMEG